MPPLKAKKVFRKASDFQRPWLHHLNDDTSWLLQVPQPAGGEKSFWNVLLDPWFDNPEVGWTKLIHWGEHVTPSAVRTIAELEHFLQKVEAIAVRLRGEDAAPLTPESLPTERPSQLDAVVVTLDLSDHCHKDTLLEIHPSVPLYGLKRSANLVRCFKHFENVHTIPFYTSGSNWQAHSIPLGTSEISIAGLRQAEDQNKTQLFYGCMIVIPPPETLRRDSGPGSSLPTPKSGEAVASHEAIVYLPHGIYSPHLAHIPTAKPPIRTLALIHNLHHITFGLPFRGWNFDSNIGAHAGLQTQQLLGAKYWFGTHDEEKAHGGLTGFIEFREKLGFQEVIEASLGVEEAERAPIGTLWRELESGEGMLLAP